VLVLEGRDFTAKFRLTMAQDIDLEKPYPVWTPTLGDVVLFVSGRHTSREQWVPIGDGFQGRVEVSIPTEQREHPDGRQCKECRIYDPATGKDMFTKKTHEFVNGGLSELEWTITAEAESRDAAPLTENNVGWCFKTKSLVAGNAPACVEQFKEKK
jgi:hypothetical protein